MSRVFICLATHEPAPDLLARQIESLSAQSLRDWTGLVYDDGSSDARAEELVRLVAREPRLRLARGARVGFYRNFERALLAAPKDAPYLALCDQDDRWHPDKLARQLAVLERDPCALAVYTDLRLVERDGAIRQESFWARRPHDRRFRALLYNNVATGATMLMRRGLRELALPFPHDAGAAFHDHWLALCAAACGGLVYLDEALVDYTQHGGNVIGAQALEHLGPGAAPRLVARFAGELLTRPRAAAERAERLAAHGTRAYTQLSAFAEALRARAPGSGYAVAAALRPFGRGRALGIADLLGPTTLVSRARGEETNLEPLKIAAGLLWASVPRGRP